MEGRKKKVKTLVVAMAVRMQVLRKPVKAQKNLCGSLFENIIQVRHQATSQQ